MANRGVKGNFLSGPQWLYRRSISPHSYNPILETWVSHPPVEDCILTYGNIAVSGQRELVLWALIQCPLCSDLTHPIVESLGRARKYPWKYSFNKPSERRTKLFCPHIYRIIEEEQQGREAIRLQLSEKLKLQK